MRACVRLTREIFAQPAFDPYRAREIQPGADVQSDEEIDAFVRAKVESAFHPSCSCKMGGAAIPWPSSIRRRGSMDSSGLRIVDSSIMPSITTGNLNAPTIMLAEKAADHILGHAPLLRDPRHRIMRARLAQRTALIGYRGTNPDHTFTLKWGRCKQAADGSGQTIVAEVLDSQWQDAATDSFKKTTRFSLEKLGCRPVKLTLRTAPRFYYSLPIPARTASAH
jgi:hypothetical protein